MSKLTKIANRYNLRTNPDHRNVTPLNKDDNIQKNEALKLYDKRALTLVEFQN